MSSVAKRGSTTEEMALMNKFARLSAEERKRIIDEFLDEMLGGPTPPTGRARICARPLPTCLMIPHQRRSTPGSSSPK
jgi:hypothetical protein